MDGKQLQPFPLVEHPVVGHAAGGDYRKNLLGRSPVDHIGIGACRGEEPDYRFSFRVVPVIPGEHQDPRSLIVQRAVNLFQIQGMQVSDDGNIIFQNQRVGLVALQQLRIGFAVTQGASHLSCVQFFTVQGHASVEVKSRTPLFL